MLELSNIVILVYSVILILLYTIFLCWIIWQLPWFIFHLGATTDAEDGLFSVEVFQRDIVPQLVRLFGVHDATVRGILLAYLPYYVSLIPKDVLANEVVSGSGNFCFFKLNAFFFIFIQSDLCDILWYIMFHNILHTVLGIQSCSLIFRLMQKRLINMRTTMPRHVVALDSAWAYNFIEK